MPKEESYFIERLYDAIEVFPIFILSNIDLQLWIGMRLEKGLSLGISNSLQIKF